jgi:hypothetical protein
MPGQNEKFCSVQSIVHWLTSHAGCGSWHVPPWHVAPLPPQSASEQHCALQMHWSPLAW